mgnify:FL=1
MPPFGRRSRWGEASSLNKASLRSAFCCSAHFPENDVFENVLKQQNPKMLGFKQGESQTLLMVEYINLAKHGRVSLELYISGLPPFGRRSRWILCLHLFESPAASYCRITIKALKGRQIYSNGLCRCTKAPKVRQIYKQGWEQD